jgi:predicted nucleic-acid-binding protein
MRAADANVLVRFVTRGDQKQAESAEEFVSKGAWVSQLVLAETAWVLDSVYDHTRDVAKAVEMLLNHERLTLPEQDLVEAAVEKFRQHKGVTFFRQTPGWQTSLEARHPSPLAEHDAVHRRDYGADHRIEESPQRRQECPALIATAHQAPTDDDPPSVRIRGEGEIAYAAALSPASWKISSTVLENAPGSRPRNPKSRSTRFLWASVRLRTPAMGSPGSALRSSVCKPPALNSLCNGGVSWIVNDRTAAASMLAHTIPRTDAAMAPITASAKCEELHRKAAMA